MLLIVGLGNPGKKYQNSRHNLGWRWLEQWRESSDDTFSPWKKTAKLLGELSQSEDKKITLFKPLTFMNESGRAVKSALKFYKLKTENLVVAHDDLDLPLGGYKLQIGRGAAGHHGVESIISALGTKNFIRLRLGIKPLSRLKPNQNFVLENFSKEENSLIETALPDTNEIFKKYLASKEEI